MNEKKVFNVKRGKVNDNWHHWTVIPETGTKHAFVKITDSLIKEHIQEEHRDIHHEVALIYLRPWTGFRDNTTENTSNYISYVKKAYWDGRIDQFLIAELIPGKPPVIHDFDREAMYRKAKELGMSEEQQAQ